MQFGNFWNKKIPTIQDIVNHVHEIVLRIFLVIPKMISIKDKELFYTL